MCEQCFEQVLIRVEQQSEQVLIRVEHHLDPLLIQVCEHCVNVYSATLTHSNMSVHGCVTQASPPVQVQVGLCARNALAYLEPSVAGISGRSTLSCG